MAHTPGPWKNLKSGDAGDYEIRTSGNYPLAWVNHSQIHDTPANARLIAAAPQMLEACERAAIFFANVEGIDETVRLAHLDRLNAAIAAAEGRS
jgi:hypothetical protein